MEDHAGSEPKTISDSDSTGFDCMKRQKTTPPLEFEFETLAQRSRDFDTSHLMGLGFAGNVYYIEINDGEPVAAKALLERQTPFSRNDFLKQVSNIARLDHENVVKLIGYTSCDEKEPPARLLVYEFAPHFSLYDNLHGTYEEALQLNWDQRLKILMDTAKGLRYLHSELIAYQDLKSRNVLIFYGLKAKIADINVWYRNPDLTNIYPDCGHHTFDDGWSSYDHCYHVNDFDIKSDVYSFGVLIMEVLTGMKDVEKDRPCLLARAAPKLAKSKLPHIIDPKLGKLENHQSKAAAKLGALAAYCSLCPPDMRPDMKFVVHILQFIVDNLDDAEIEKRTKDLEARIGDDFTNHVAEKLESILEEDDQECWFIEKGRKLLLEFSRLTLDPEKEMLKAEIWLLKY